MTIAIAWVREIGRTSELVFASDSRLSGGGNIDSCQKVFSLPREDCALAFCGRAFIAYPFIVQVQNLINEHRKSFDRATDVGEMKGKIVGLLNRFVNEHQDYVPEDFEADKHQTQFLFGGWSWRKSKFYLWEIYYEKDIRRFVAGDTGIWKLFKLTEEDQLKLGFVGDYFDDFIARLKELLSTADGNVRTKLDYEPLQVLASMLQDPRFVDRREERRGLIGGAPQLMKVYPFLRTMSFGVRWQSKKGPRIALRGRILSPIETIMVPIINPNTLEVTYPLARVGLIDDR
jgi:hypothetical protein